MSSRGGITKKGPSAKAATAVPLPTVNPVLRNKDKDKVKKGKGTGSGKGGDTGLPPSRLFYCGSFKNECRCGTCDGYCGRDDGCPCTACVELLGFKVNGDGHLAKPGSTRSILEGDTGKAPKDLFYCGKRKRGCRCGTCNEICGPEDGCPCRSCLALVGGTIDDSNNGRTIRWEKVEMEEEHSSTETDDEESSSSSDSESESSNSDSNDNEEAATRSRPRPGILRNHPPAVPTSTVVSDDGLAQDFDRLLVPPPPTRASLGSVEEYINTAGMTCRRGVPGLPGGSTGIDAGQLFYCGSGLAACDCPDQTYCNGVCGPRGGCPCSFCLELYFDLLLADPNSSFNRANDIAVADKPATSTSTSSSQKEMTIVEDGLKEDGEMCVICWVEKKSHVLVPCGHYSYCENCVEPLNECALCRTIVNAKVKVFEG